MAFRLRASRRQSSAKKQLRFSPYADKENKNTDCTDTGDSSTKPLCLGTFDLPTFRAKMTRSQLSVIYSTQKTISNNLQKINSQMEWLDTMISHLKISLHDTHKTHEETPPENTIPKDQSPERCLVQENTPRNALTEIPLLEDRLLNNPKEYRLSGDFPAKNQLPEKLIPDVSSLTESYAVTRLKQLLHERQMSKQPSPEKNGMKRNCDSHPPIGRGMIKTFEEFQQFEEKMKNEQFFAAVKSRLEGSRCLTLRFIKLHDRLVWLAEFIDISVLCQFKKYDFVNTRVFLCMAQAATSCIHLEITLEQVRDAITKVLSRARRKIKRKQKINNNPTV